jgi:MFS family permease
MKENTEEIINNNDDIYNNIHLNEKQIETALKKTRTIHNSYCFIAITIFLIANTAVYSTLTGIPFYQYEKKYLCKAENSEIFNVECSKKFICNDNVELGVDYIVDEENTVELKSIISEFKLKCNDKKIILLNIFYFIGTLVGILLIPIFNVHFGTLTTIFISYLIFSVTCIFISLIKNFTILAILYFFLNLSYGILFVLVIQYLTEMIDPLFRTMFITFNVISNVTSGYLCILICYYTKNYKYLFLICGIISLIGAIFVKIYLVDSIRTLFHQGKIKELIQSLNWISKMNESYKDFEEWKKNNLYKNNKDNINDNNEKKLFTEVNYINIFKFPSQIKIIILFSLISFLANYLLLFIQLEIKKQKNFYLSIFKAYTSDLFGLFLGIFIIEYIKISRKNSFIFINSLIGILYLFCSIFYKKNNLFLICLLRVGINSFFISYTVYNFEIYPTLTRSFGTSINRIFARVFNLWTPYIMIDYPRISYIIGLFFIICIEVCVFIFNPEDTRGKIIKEYPDEIENVLNEQNNNKNDSNLLNENNNYNEGEEEKEKLI